MSMKAKVLLGLCVLLLSSAQAQAASFKVNGGGIAVIALDRPATLIDTAGF